PTSSIAPTRISSLIRHYTFTSPTFLLQILVVDGTLSSRHLSHAHFTYSVAEVDFEVHVLHGVDTSLVDGRRGDFIFHLKLRSQEVFRPESNAAFFVSKLFVQVQTIHSKSALCALKLDHFTPHKTKSLQHPAIGDVIVTK